MTKIVKIKHITIGGGAPVSIQTMTNTATTDIKATLSQIEAASLAGADIVRIAIPDSDSAKALVHIIKGTDMPIVADIHYDYRLALAAIDAGAHKIRINPSNIPHSGIREIARLALERKIPIRVGVNQGSLKGEVTPQILAMTALDNAKFLEDTGFSDIVLAVKSSNVLNTISSYRILHSKTDYPLHIGLTESGPAGYGTVKSAIAIGSLLLDNIGDTVRVSLSGDPIQEVILGRRILRAIGLDYNFAEIISCPTCARTILPVEDIAKELEMRTLAVRCPLKIAVMGCSVNGIGEAGNADFGVCGGHERSIIFKDGNKIGTVKNSDIIDELLKIMETLIGKQSS
jgi:(E)-4-hydroxy-3-methylbut-2-enyl-diphosphate synthase